MNPHILRAIHILAIVFRDIIRKRLGHELSHLEKAASFNCEHRIPVGDEDIISTKAYKRNGGIQTTEVTSWVQRKLIDTFLLTEDEYDKKRLNRIPTEIDTTKSTPHPIQIYKQDLLSENPPALPKAQSQIIP